MAKPRYAEGYEGVFGLMDFPPYVHQEYPKWIDTNQGRKLVQDRREELEWLAYVPEKAPTKQDLEELGQAVHEAKGAAAEKDAQIEALQKQLAELLAGKVAEQNSVQNSTQNSVQAKTNSASSDPATAIAEALAAAPQVSLNPKSKG